MMHASKAKRFEFSASSSMMSEDGSRKSLLAKVLLIAIVLLGVACSQIHTKTPEGKPVVMDQEEFSAYVEHVFRHHNTVVNELLFATPSGLEASDDPVATAEVKMDRACQPLNDTVLASATGLSPDYWTKMKLADAVPECEAATRILEKLFPQGHK